MFQLFRAEMSERPNGDIQDFDVETNPVMPIKELLSNPARVEGLLWLGLRELVAGLTDFIRQAEEKVGQDQHVAILFLGMPVCLPADDPTRFPPEVGFIMFQHVMAVPASSTAGGCQEMLVSPADEPLFHLEDPSLVQSPEGRAQISAAFHAKLPEYLGLTDLPAWVAG